MGKEGPDHSKLSKDEQWKILSKIDPILQIKNLEQLLYLFPNKKSKDAFIRLLETYEKYRRFEVSPKFQKYLETLILRTVQNYIHRSIVSK